MIKKISLFLLIVSAFTSVFAQSAEPGNAFNKYMSAEGGINPINGTASFSKYLASVTAGHAEAKFELMYSGNVSEIVKVKNDKVNLGWIGLGWTMGQAKIVCDHNSSMWLGDDTYHLQTSSGLTYSIIEHNGTWWIENLPYWSVERQTYKYSTKAGVYEIVKGWILKDASGVKYFYGDFDENPKDVKKHNATEYVLSYPEHYGLIGAFKDGKSYPFPCAWNLSRQEDYDGNYIVYDYDQINEYVKIGGSFTDYPYTKENYLKKVTSSFGASIEFETSMKGLVNNGADFTDEIIDNTGKSEINTQEKDNNLDGYVDPMQRRYLSKMTVKANNGKILETVEFCYKPLRVKIDGYDNTKYVKRLLSSVTTYDASRATGENDDYQSSVIDEEKYEYVDYENSVESSAGSFHNSDDIALGAIKSITGLKCGKVEYDYTQMSLFDKKEHAQKLPVNDASVGYLQDGSMYVVGYNICTLEAYLWKADGWHKMPLPSSNTWNCSSKKSFQMGRNNSFVAISVRQIRFSDSKENYDECTFVPYVWNGKEWIEQTKIVIDNKKEFVSVGPDYIVRAKVADERIKIDIPWTLWEKNGLGQVYNEKADDDVGDREKTTLITSQNHFAVYYKDKSPGHSLSLRVFTFNHDKSDVAQTYDEDNMDDENQYVFISDHVIGAAMEPDNSLGLTKHNAKIGCLLWNEYDGKWVKVDSHSLRGTQGDPVISVVGYNYFAMKHNDYDDLTLFEFDETKNDYKLWFKNKNVVDGLNYDWVVEAEWNGYSSGDDYFVITRPKRKTLKKLGVTYGYAVRKDRKVQKFFKNEAGEWKEGDISTFDESQHVILGPTWYLLKESNQLYVNNGYVWNYDGQVGNVNKNSRAVGDNYYADDSYIYFKKHDSFVNKIYGYFVTSKTVSDPVLDKETRYEYSYRDIGVSKLEDSSPYYDFSTGMPVVRAYTIILPEGKGKIVKNLCPYQNDDSSKNGLGWGLVCSERYYTNDVSFSSKPKKKITTYFDRYFGTELNWPVSMFVDYVTKISIEENNNVDEVFYTYKSDINGLQKSVKKVVNGESVEEIYNYYAPEKYSFMVELNRLSDVVGSIRCIPECDEKKGKIVSGTATILNENKNGDAVIVEPLSQWIYAPNEERISKNDFDWSSKTQSENWKKVKEITRYDKGFVEEYFDEYDIMYAGVHDNTKEKLLVASVKNAGLNEIVVVPGNNCDIDGVTDCSIEDLNVNSIQWKKNPDKKQYGKFSSKAISLNGHSFNATLNKAKKGKYRFSAWVYSEGDDVTLNISNDLSKKFNTEPYSWRYVETEFDLNADKYEWSLQKNGENRVWLQDVRLVPADASVSVTFYDDLLRKPSAIVEDRNHVVYTQYDSKGRITELYGDYLKDDGSRDVALIERNTYVEGSCLDPTYDINTLDYVMVNGDFLMPAIGEMSNYMVQTYVENLNISWKTHQDGKTVSYRIFDADVSDDEKGLFDTPPCCDVKKGVSMSFGSKEKVLELYVGDASDKIYTVKFTPQRYDWVNYGNILDVGNDPKFASDTRINRIFYVGENGLSLSAYNGYRWDLDNGYEGDFDEFCVAKNKNDKVHISASRNKSVFLYKWEPQFEVSLGANKAGWEQKNYVNLSSAESFDMAYVNDKLYTVYFKGLVPRQEGNGYSPVLYSSNLDENVKSISEYNVIDFKIVADPNDRPMVAYIGKVPSQFKSTTLVNDLDESYSDEQLESELTIPSEMLMSVSFSDNYVVVKHLSKDGRWVGYSSEEGDLLKLEDKYLVDAIRLAVASDELNTYIAVLYESKEGVNALSVFKSVKNGEKVSFEVMTDAAVNSNEIAYLDKNDPMDLMVDKGVPYLMFANKQNENKVSVLRYDEKDSRWLSVGNPAFASIETSKYAGNLGFDKDNDSPVIVFKERYDSPRSGLRNKIVPMKYVKDDDLDVSLSSIGGSSPSAFTSEFRQYILSYTTDVDCDENELKLNFHPMNVENVKMTYSVDEQKDFEIYPNTDVKIPLRNLDHSLIKVNLLGTNGKRLTYKFKVNKTCPAQLAPSATNSMMWYYSAPLPTNESSSSSSSDETNLVYEIDGNDPYVCFSDYGNDWNFVAYGVVYTKYACIDLTNPKLPEYSSSSSDNVPESSSSCDYFFKNEKTGDERCVTLVVRSSSSSKGYPWWYDISSSSIPTSGGSTGTSAGEEGYSSGINGGSSSSYNPSVTIPGTSIPQIYESIYKHKLATTGDLKFADNVNVSGIEFVGNNVEVGANARINGTLTSMGDMHLRNDSYTSKIVVGEKLNVENGARYESVIQEKDQIPLIPTVDFAVGENDVNVWNNQTAILKPGKYKTLHVYSNATVYFEAGSYYFENFEIEADAKIVFENKIDGMQIWIQEILRIGDRVQFVCEGGADQLMIYSNTNQMVYLGVSSELKATLIIPNGSASFSPNSVWIGKVWAKSIDIQPNVTVK